MFQIHTVNQPEPGPKAIAEALSYMKVAWLMLCKGYDTLPLPVGFVVQWQTLIQTTDLDLTSSSFQSGRTPSSSSSSSSSSALFWTLMCRMFSWVFLPSISVGPQTRSIPTATGPGSQPAGLTPIPGPSPVLSARSSTSTGRTSASAASAPGGHGCQWLIRYFTSPHVLC